MWRNDNDQKSIVQSPKQGKDGGKGIKEDYCVRETCLKFSPDKSVSPKIAWPWDIPVSLLEMGWNIMDLIGTKDYNMEI